MVRKNHLTVSAVVAASVTVWACASAGGPGGAGGGAAMSSTAASMQPTNDLPNPYRTIEGWAKMPAGRSWGSTSAVDVDRDGVSIWVAERCSTNQRGCLVNNTLDPVLKFDANGNMVESFGAGVIVWPHGIHVDRDGNVWVVDGQDNRPQTPRGGGAAPPMPSRVYGHQVIKFSPTGQVLLRLGREGGVPMEDKAAAGARNDFFWQPNDVHTAPNGDIFVGEGHGAGGDRIIKFNSRGEYIAEWGGRGTGPGQFNQPHSLAMDSQGRLFVADRGNSRIQIFDQEGTHLATWTQFGRPSGLFIDGDDVLYATDSESNTRRNPGWKRGIYIGSAKTGWVTTFIPDPEPNQDASATSGAEGIAVDAEGSIYGAEVGPQTLRKYARRR